jgi:hypothetical protein
MFRNQNKVHREKEGRKISRVSQGAKEKYLTAKSILKHFEIFVIAQ